MKLSKEELNKIEGGAIFNNRGYIYFYTWSNRWFFKTTKM